MIVNIFSLQAAIHYHLPYSSLYGRINRLKREQATEWAAFRDYEDPELEDTESSNGLEFRYTDRECESDQPEMYFPATS